MVVVVASLSMMVVVLGEGVGVVMMGGAVVVVVAVAAAAAAAAANGDGDIDGAVESAPAGSGVDMLDVRPGSGSGLVALEAVPALNHDAVSKASDDEGGIGGRRERGRPRSAGLTPVLSV